MPVRDNRYIPEEDRDFFILLWAGLWQKAEEPLSDAPDWEYIYTIACEQTVQGIVADGITILKAAYGQGRFDTPFPTGEHWQETYDKFLSAVAQIVRRNHTVNRMQAYFCSILNQNDIHYAIIKGQIVGQNYPKPMLRCSGDIDILVREEDYKQAKDIALRLATAVLLDNSPKNIDFRIDNIVLEIHGVALSYFAAQMDKCIEQERILMHTNCDYGHTDCYGIDVATANIHYHSLFLLYHIIRHITHTGLGLRQICDFAVFINRNASSINITWLKDFLIKSGALHHWNFFLKFSMDFLGMPANPSLHISIDSLTIRIWAYIKYRCQNPVSPTAAQIWKQCRLTGNMGHKTSINENNFNHRNKIERNLRHFQYVHSYVWNNFRLYPRQSLKTLSGFYVSFLKNISQLSYRKIIDRFYNNQLNVRNIK
ncbi:MAG: nucleotidyltransferase family protein [Bacteroidaceae bacterium]|nr:nucleotidyltransferase family protein [Bacteroidaceae bacterium]